MYFHIQKVIKVPSLEKGQKEMTFKDFNEELFTYFKNLKYCMAKKNINYFSQYGPVFYKCYLTGCNKAYRNKRDLTVHLRRHVSYSL
jgi:hypothetical protein